VEQSTAKVTAGHRYEKEKETIMNIVKNRGLLWMPALLFVLAGLVWAYTSWSRPAEILEAMAEATHVDVSSKIPGRIDTVMVEEGSFVKRGQVLARLSSREIDAKVGQAAAATRAAQAKYQMALHGARPEERLAAEKMYETARVQLDLAEKTYRRIQAVFADSVISVQEHDQMLHQYQAAQEQAEAAKARYEMVLHGARREEIDGARALLEQAQNGLQEALAYQSECEIKAPIDGLVSKRLLDRGEMAAGGYPVFTLMDVDDIWLVLQAREDQIADLKTGQIFYGTIPALRKSRVAFRVASMAVMADFSTWRSTHQKGDFDVKTFEIKLVPTLAVNGLRPGMSVRLQR
jgi:HlyD family secretion protein